MNTPTPPPRNDDELTPEERELAALYRQLPQAEPDRTLDDEILAQAARAVSGTRGLHRRGPPRWIFGVGTAAVLVLAAGLAWRLQQPGANRQHAPTPMTGATTYTAKPTAAAPPAFAPAMAPLPALPSPPPPAPKHATLQSPRGTLRAKAARSNAMPAPPPTPPSPPPPPKLRAQPQPPAGVRKSAEPRIAPPLAAPAPPPVREQVAPRIAPPPAPPAPPPPLQEISTNAVALPPLQRESKAAAAGTAGLPASALSSASPPTTPKAEIQHIRDLLRAGHRKKAVTALRTFRHVHPDYSLPADLKELLGDGH